MKNCKEESRDKNNQDDSERILYAHDTQTPILVVTSQREVSSRIEIKLGRTQLHEAQWLFEQYGKPKPSWLRGKFLLNQFRRKALNDNLREAQLDEAFCGICCDSSDWAGLLHFLWHDINGKTLCV